MRHREVKGHTWHHTASKRQGPEPESRPLPTSDPEFLTYMLYISSACRYKYIFQKWGQKIPTVLGPMCIFFLLPILRGHLSMSIHKELLDFPTSCKEFPWWLCMNVCLVLCGWTLGFLPVYWNYQNAKMINYILPSLYTSLMISSGKLPGQFSSNTYMVLMFTLRLEFICHLQ